VDDLVGCADHHGRGFSVTMVEWHSTFWVLVRCSDGLCRP
jgi:hypothetical protein